MKSFAKLALGALVVSGVAFASAAPAAARVSVGVSFGFGYPGYAYDDPCAYYDYYDVPPPWGLPPGYCGYQVYFGPVYWHGYWYRGPIYYRWHHGRRIYWLHGGWRHNQWRGRRPAHIRWHDRGWHGGAHWRGGVRVRGGGNWHGGVRVRGGAGHWHGGSHTHSGGHHGHGGRHH